MNDKEKRIARQFFITGVFLGMALGVWIGFVLWF